MKRFDSIPLPALMRDLPKDKRGYPIPVSVQRDTEGRPHFTVTDSAVRAKCLHDDTCGICGKPHHRRRALVGGVAAAFHPMGAFMDGPMHYECAKYAIQVCPYLAAPNYSKRIDERTMKPEHIPADHVIKNVGHEDHTEPRPEIFLLVLYDREDEQYIKDDTTGELLYIKPKLPYKRVEFWRHGETVAETIAEPILEKELADALEKDIRAGRIHIQEAK